MKRIATALLAAVLAGCATENTIVRTVEVKVPVPVPCRIEPIERPAFAFDAVTPAYGLYEKGRALLAEREQRIAYEARLEAAITACQ